MIRLYIGEYAGSCRRPWRHIGFSVHNRIRTQANEAAGPQRLARYIIRCPITLEKLRSKLHATLKWVGLHRKVTRDLHRKLTQSVDLNMAQVLAPFSRPASFIVSG